VLLNYRRVSWASRVSRKCLQAWSRSACGIVICVIAPSLVCAQDSETRLKCPPPTRLDLAKDTYGTTVVADPYRWLENQDSPETRAWIVAQQKCTEAALSSVPGRAKISNRLAEIYQTGSYEVPVERAGRYFFLKRPERQDLSSLYVRRGKNATEEILIDPLPWSSDHSASVTLENVSRDGKLLFYGRREGGQDEITSRVLNVDTKETLSDAFRKAQYINVEPTPDKQSRLLFYRHP
jgi:prolyl oligopeptidase